MERLAIRHSLSFNLEKNRLIKKQLMKISHLLQKFIEFSEALSDDGYAGYFQQSPTSSSSVCLF